MPLRRDLTALTLCFTLGSSPFWGCSLATDFAGYSGRTVDGGGRPPESEGGSEPDVDPPVGDAAAGRYPATVLSDHPIAYYRLGESVGNLATDETRNFPAEYIGTFSFGAEGALPGDRDTAVGPNEPGGCITLGKKLDFVDTKPFTLEAWVKLKAMDSAYRHIFNINYVGANAGLREQFGLYARLEDGLVFERTVAGLKRAAVAKTFATGKYVHIAAVYSGQALVLYLDGEVVSTDVDTRSSAPKDADFVLGCREPTLDSVLGFMDEVAIYDKELSAARIRAHYTAVRP